MVKNVGFYLVLLLGFCSLEGWPTVGISGPIAERLTEFVGKPSADVMASFGTATVMAPGHWVYAYNPYTATQPPYFPEPVDANLGATTGRVGIGPGKSSPRVNMPCEIDFRFDAEGLVSEVSHHGPGCFEIVFSRTKPP